MPATGLRLRCDIAQTANDSKRVVDVIVNFLLYVFKCQPAFVQGIFCCHFEFILVT